MDLRRHLTAADILVHDENSGRSALDRAIVWRGPDAWMTHDVWERGRHSEDRVAIAKAPLPALAFVRRGSFIEDLDGDERAVDASHVYLYNVGRPTRTRNPWGESREGNMLYVSPELTAEVARAAWGERPDSLPFPVASVRMSAGTFSLYQHLVRYLTSPEPVDEVLVEDALFTLLSEAMGVPEATEFDRGLGRRIPQVQAYLSADPARPHTLSELGKRFGASRYHLSRVFRLRTGETISRYVVRARLRQALPRILDGEPIADVAVDAGFYSHSHFANAFREEFGEPPSAARSGTARDRVARRAKRC